MPGKARRQLNGRVVLRSSQKKDLQFIKQTREYYTVKKMLATVFCFVASTSLAGNIEYPLPTVDSKINYSEVVTVDGAKKDNLYSKAKLWIANTFHSSDDLILDDRENGVILSKGTIQIKENEVAVRSFLDTKTPIVKTWEFTLKIQLKDGRYKAEMYDIEYTFAMPGNNIGHTPLSRNLDILFLDKKMYKKDGSLKGGGPSNIAQWTNENFNSLLVSLKKALTENVVVDDF